MPTTAGELTGWRHIKAHKTTQHFAVPKLFTNFAQNIINKIKQLYGS